MAPQKKRTILFISWLALAIISLVLVFLTGWFIVRPARNYYLTFLRSAGMSNAQFWEVLQKGWQGADRYQTQENFTALVIGLDQREYQDEQEIMTDSLQLINYNVTNQTLAVLPLPRDIYLPDLSLKINAVYNQALKAGSARPEIAVATYISQWLSEPIDYALVFDFSQVIEMIDLLGGVDVLVENGFTDRLYPRSGVDVSVETDPKVLYETITFAQGLNHLDGETALKFMRSRHAVGSEGSDLARSKRQQQVMTALLENGVKKFFNSETFLDYVLLGQLYQFYEDNYERYLPLDNLISMIRAADLWQNWLPGGDKAASFMIRNEALSIYPLDEKGVLTEVDEREMARDYYGMWVWKVLDWEAFEAEINQKLGFI